MRVYNFYGDKNRKRYFDEGGEFETHEEAVSFADRMTDLWNSEVVFYNKDNPDKKFFAVRAHQECYWCGDVVPVSSGYIDDMEDFYCCEECCKEHEHEGEENDN